MKKTPTRLEILKDLRRLFTSEKHWTKHVFYEGDSKYCILGGIGKLYANNPDIWDNHDKLEPIIIKVGKALGFKDNIHEDIQEQLANWNNREDLSHKDFLARIDKAIKKLEA